MLKENSKIVVRKSNNIFIASYEDFQAKGKTEWSAIKRLHKKMTEKNVTEDKNA